MQRRYMFILVCMSTMVMAQERRQLDYGQIPRRAPVQRMERAIVPKHLVPQRYQAQPPRSVTRREAAEAALQRDAASWGRHFADHLANGLGFREFYRMGFYRGMRDILDVPPERHWAYSDGYFRGQRNVNVVRDGARLGEQEAQGLATERAKEDVETQFLDMSREPVRRPYVGRFDVPAFNMSGHFEKPTLANHMEVHRLDRLQNWSGANYVFYDEWRPDPWRIYDRERLDSHYDKRWQDASYAWECFLADRNATTSYRALDDARRYRFKDYFLDAFRRALYDCYVGTLQNAWWQGHGDGWRYATWWADDYFYRLGYFNGAAYSFNNAAAQAFNRSYGAFYGDTYGVHFDDWMRNPKMSYQDLTLVDGNQDGIFEPGETVRLFYQLVNFGGRSGRFNPALSGPFLNRAQGETVDVPRRSSGYAGTIHGEIRRDARLGATSAVFEIGEVRGDIELNISWPMVFNGTVEIVSRNNLNGEARLRVSVANVSQKRLDGVELMVDGVSHRVPGLNAGLSWQKDINLRGLDPLDMIGGSVKTGLQLENDWKRYDTMHYSLPEVASDLNSWDLWALLFDAAKQGADQNRVNRLHDLVLLRMQSDWRRAIAARGNPYKKDRRKGSRLTEVGYLIGRFEEEKHEMRDPGVILSLRPKLRDYARQLRGTHPFLRKQYRRLVDTLQ